MSTSPPTKVRVDKVRDWVRSQPSTGVVLVRFGIVLWAQVDFADRIGEEIPAPDQLSANSDVLTNVPSEGGASKGKSLGFPGAGLENGDFIFPHR